MAARDDSASASARALAGQAAIITGARRGIGRAIARAYAAAGAAVCCAARSRGEVEATAAGIRAAGGAAFAFCADVSVESDVAAMVQETVERHGGLDVLVANAGVDLESRTVADSDAALWRATIDTNLTGAYLCARAAVPHLRRRGAGKII